MRWRRVDLLATLRAASAKEKGEDHPQMVMEFKGFTFGQHGFGFIRQRPWKSTDSLARPAPEQL